MKAKLTVCVQGNSGVVYMTADRVEFYEDKVAVMNGADTTYVSADDVVSIQAIME